MSTRHRQTRVRQIMAEIGEIGHALPGSVVIRSTACGKPVCKCKADPPQLHGPYLSWIRKDDGKPVTRKLTPDQEQRYRPWFDNARHLRELVTELVTELESLSLEAFDHAEGPRQRKS
ncbi:MAG: DUF6788 family protein [Streptosporangiaceae bacterium]